jgi:azurin
MRKIYLITIISLFSFIPSSFANDHEKNCNIQIASGDTLKFDQSELQISSSCDKVMVTFTHNGKLPANVMGHNWVLSKTSDVKSIASDGLTAGATNGYLKDGDERVIAATKVIGGGETATVTFSTGQLSPTESYTFFCSFAGHSFMMKGPFKIV